MLTYRQSTGELSRAGVIVGRGYSGRGEGKNNPAMQAVKNIGPLPVGKYSIGPIHSHASKGPDVMCLTPQAGNEMYGRDGFLIHGDSKAAPGTASHGCIIMARSVRVAVDASGDRELEVVS